MIVSKSLQGDVIVDGQIITAQSYRFPENDPECFDRVFELMPEGISVELPDCMLAFLDTPRCREYQEKYGFRKPAKNQSSQLVIESSGFLVLTIELIY